MRAAFVATMVELATLDPRIVLLTADLGFMAFEPFAEKFPDRFFNVGVAEQNMMGMATGLAEAGFIPFAYSIATFATLRPYEFIRNGPILHHLPVRIVGVGGGFEYGSAGATHHAVEDVGVMRVQPGITVIAPADSAQTRTAIAATWNLPGPIYYRIGKNDKAVVPGLDGRFEFGSVQVIRQGGDILILAMGAIASEVQAAAALLAEQGIETTVGVVASVHPPPTDDLIDLLNHFRVVMTVEAHNIVGGVGSLVAEVIAENGIPTRLTRCGIRQTFSAVSGSQSYLEHEHGLSAPELARTALQLVEKAQ